MIAKRRAELKLEKNHAAHRRKWRVRLEKLQAQATADRRPLAGMIRKILHDATKQAPEAGANAA